MCLGSERPGGAFVRSVDTARFLVGGGGGCELRNNFWAKVWGLDWLGGWREGRLWRRRRLKDIVTEDNHTNYSQLASSKIIRQFTFNAIIHVCLFIPTAAFYPAEKRNLMFQEWPLVKII